MYKIMLVKSKRCECQSLYQFLTTTVDDVVKPVEFETIEELDAFVESMINNGYSKSDFIIVHVIDYEISAGPYSDEESP